MVPSIRTSASPSKSLPVEIVLVRSMYAPTVEYPPARYVQARRRAELRSCSLLANVCKHKAVQRIEHRLISVSGNGEWALLSDLFFSANYPSQVAQIDIVAIGSAGVRVIEVKHWWTHWIDRN